MSPKRQTALDQILELPFTPLKPAVWYKPVAHNVTSLIPAEAVLYVVPFVIGRAAILDRIGTEVTVVGTAGAVVRLGIYHDSGQGYPGSLLLDAGTIDGTSATSQAITIAQAIKPGLWWMAGAVQGAAGTRPTVRVINQGNWSIAGDPSAGAPNHLNQNAGYSQASVTGALPATFTATVTSTGSPISIVIRASA